MTDEQASLDRLCALCGIDTAYHDLWGQLHAASEATKLALLDAMGIPLGSTADAPRALAELEAREWRETLPPVIVSREGEPVRILFCIPGREAPASIEWRIETESGEHRSGRAEGVQALQVRELAGEPFCRSSFELPDPAGPGYHRLSLTEADRDLGTTRLIVCPGRCFEPPLFASGARLWGPAIQLYALRSRRNWGMGDFSDLGALVDFMGPAGAGIVGINPLHALAPARPEEASPYNPSNRMALNVLYIDVEAIADYDECPAARERVRSADFQARLDSLRGTELVDYTGVAAAKLEVLGLLFGHFRERHLGRDTERARAFSGFLTAGGEALRLHAAYEALLEHLLAKDPGAWGWPAWPDAYRRHDSPAVEAFAREHAERVQFFQYLQWLAQLQLGGAARRARSRGFAVGLYTDLAVGASMGGAETWARPEVYAAQASVGAPPDEFNQKGQNWGLAPFVPKQLAAAAYQPFIAMLRSCMRHSGALRIDHVMTLMRLFWIPARGEARDGTYVRYPMEDLFGILALESRRHRCLVIGEDLGTVPPEVQEAMSRYGVYHYRPLYFERTHEGDFKPPEQYPTDALVAVSTHDLPTLRGFWQAADLAARLEHGLFPDEGSRARAAVERAQDRVRLLIALERAGLLPPGTSVKAPAMADIDDTIVAAVHAFIARAPSRILVIQLEDLLGQVAQANLPATTEAQHPNWRRKLPLAMEEWKAHPLVTGIARLLGRERGAAPGTDQDESPFPEGGGSGRPPRGPRATYRLQLHRGFRFEHATALVPYLAALGVSHIYSSPFLKARPGSTHGYDIIDHNAINPEIGTEEQLERLFAALRRHGMGMMVDLVPNHMGIMDSDNAWWLDVLENGQASAYASYFDIEWEPTNEVLRGKVLVPVLGVQYGAALEEGELRLAFDAGAGEFSIHYDKHRFPIDPREYPRILGAGRPAGPPEQGHAEYESLAAAFGHLPPRSDPAPQKAAERARDKQLRKRQLAELCERAPEIRRRVDECVAAFHGTPGRPATFDRLHELMEAQAWRLAHWRVAGDDINFRRFFDIHDLAALRMESEAVFEDTHRLILRLVHEGKIDALRVDHPDGLYDPGQYFERLQRRALPPGREAPAEPGAQNIYIAVEKILAQHERLPDSWPVAGTTGYRFVNLLNGLFVDARAERDIDRAYAAFIGERIDYEELVHDSKVLIQTNALSSEMSVLSNMLSRIARADRRHRDFTLNNLRRALVEIVANFPVYRTYFTDSGMRQEDRRYVDWAVAKAKKYGRAAEGTVHDFIRQVLAGDLSPERGPYRSMVEAFVRRFQQFTSPVTAKAVEDTSFYVYNRLASLNEVGGEPRAFGMSLKAFHAASLDRLRSAPRTMIATSTHDNKRSEDVRTRIDVLSEAPAAWRLALRRWSRLNRRKKTALTDGPAPSKNDEYLLYQAMLGACPLEPVDAQSFDAAALETFRQRIDAYMLKAAREAKSRTSWINPNEEYERALSAFIAALLRPEGNPFLKDFLAAKYRVARYGMASSLSQTLIKLASPGVPDIYQGTELWDFSLVDPDNRRPVDYGLRRRNLESLRAADGEDRARLASDLVKTLEDGRIKQYVIWKVLSLRREWRDLFELGEYIPLLAQGAKGEHVCAFARRHEGRTVVAVAPRLVLQLANGEDRLPLGDVWGDTRLPLPAGGSYVNAFTGERHEIGETESEIGLAELLATFPVALLISV